MHRRWPPLQNRPTLPRHTREMILTLRRHDLRAGILSSRYQGQHYETAAEDCFSANPFSDPASPTFASNDSRIRTLSGMTAVPVSPLRGTFARKTSEGLSTLQRPILPHSMTETESLSSATSMQIFVTNGPLRIANNPSSTSTADVSLNDLHGNFTDAVI